jgi:hypothetical protein
MLKFCFCKDAVISGEKKTFRVLDLILEKQFATAINVSRAIRYNLFVVVAAAQFCHLELVEGLL